MELGALKAAGVDTEATLNALIDLITESGRTYADLGLGLRRTYNQAWFTRIYIDAISDDPTDELEITGEHTVIADALEGSRELTLATLENSKAGPVGPAMLIDLCIQYAKGSSKNPLVELRGFEPLTPSMRTRCATGLRHSPYVRSFPALRERPEDTRMAQSLTARRCSYSSTCCGTSKYSSSPSSVSASTPGVRRASACSSMRSAVQLLSARAAST